MFEHATDDFFEKNIRPNLEASRFLLVLATPGALESGPDGNPNWVDREIETFLKCDQNANLIVVRASGNDLTGELPGKLHIRFPRLEIIDFRDWTRLRARLDGALQEEFLKIVAPLFEFTTDELPRLRRADRWRRRIRRTAGLVTAFMVIIVLLAVASRQLQDPIVRSVTSWMPFSWCRAEPRGSVVQRFEHGWLLAWFSANTFYAIRQAQRNQIEWMSFPDPYRGGRPACDGVADSHLLQRGFRMAVCDSPYATDLRSLLGRPLSFEGRVLLQYQWWLDGLLVVGLPATTIGLALSERDQQNEFAALDTVFLSRGRPQAKGYGLWNRVSGTDIKRSYCSAIWFRSVSGMNWAGLSHPSTCLRTRDESYYLESRLRCDSGS